MSDSTQQRPMGFTNTLWGVGTPIMSIFKSVMSWVMMILTRYPGMVAACSFAAGVGSFVLVERKQEIFAQALSLLMLASWVWLIAENLLHRQVNQWFGVSLPRPILKFLAQLVHQESLFFVIPFFFITTAWNSGQAVFTGLLILFGVVSIIDPLYYHWLSKRRWLYFIYHSVTLFAVLLTALPILLHIPTGTSYLHALVIAVILSLLSVERDLPFRWYWTATLALGLMVASIAFGLWVRPWIPPASLWLTDVAITTQIDDARRAPQDKLLVVSEEQMHRGLYAYTSIHAPRGLQERIYHEWMLQGELVDRIALDIRGGRDEGYRAWTHKLNFPTQAVGDWKIRIATETGQLIGILRFKVVEALRGKIQRDEFAADDWLFEDDSIER